ncbi:MAG: tagaturonate reductase [Chitinophagaceae bacterium]|nr:tagaturonate reductase [Chitinophagaceae bacterium]
MQLNKSTLAQISNAAIQKPGNNIFDLPEKVLQFGTGVLLRGLPDYFIDKANKQNVFNGRVVVIKSTDSGGADAFDEQDGLYTICVQGLEKGKQTEETIINSAISRVLSAKSEWKAILDCAHNAEMNIIISNTTEVGITLVEEDIHQTPPASFPAKLLAFLHKRYEVCGGEAEGGCVIIPTELIVGNGDKLKSIVLQLAAYNKLEKGFVKWLQSANTFCNSLVDRIVPGKPASDVKEKFEKTMGYTDDLLIVCEPYRLWAIEGDDRIRKMLSFDEVDDGVVITPDIEKYRELKLRLLNGTHTLSCGLAYLAGFTFVRESMTDKAFSGFVRDIMLKEIAPAIPANVADDEAESFGNQVLDRFANPFLNHQWISITMQYTSKMKMRVIPVLLRYFAIYNTVPQNMAKGFAAYILFMKAVKKNGNIYEGELNGNAYPINDDKAGYLYELWQKHGDANIVKAVLSDKTLWDADLSTLPGFVEMVQKNFVELRKK